MQSQQIRQLFTAFFAEKGHQILPSSSLIPANDPTLLFTNAGMVQFKEVFLGKEAVDYDCAVTVQRCVRAGGKHNDLENVGYTARHHTFFEMLGNFSFGAYFKREAIQYAWQFLTETLKLPPERLWVTVYEEDKETESIWLQEMRIDPKRFSRCGMKDNFWAMGETGPCGPCTEIFYDYGPAVAGGPPGSPEADGDRYVEVWNLVFMQYERNEQGELKPLAKPAVDTGMGLERLAAVLQGVNNNYDTDLLKPLVVATAKLIGTDDLTQTSLRVIADHIRSCAFLIHDGILPSNEGRGYVLRRIIRRAIRHGHKLGLQKEPFFYQLVQPLVEIMKTAYPSLEEAQPHIEQTLYREEQQFSLTLSQGLKALQEELTMLGNKQLVPGKVIFKLYDTYGFPPDLTADIAREQGLSCDMAGFEQAMAMQKQRSQLKSQFKSARYIRLPIQQVTEFVGYDTWSTEATVLAILNDEYQPIDFCSSGEKAILIVDKTPFYAEAGGQIGDQGVFQGENVVFEVTDTQKQGEIYLHYGVVRTGTLRTSQSLEARVAAHLRQATMLNHSATHLLHAALRKVLGTHVIQKGSLVEPARLRFDFSHPQPLSSEEIEQVETLVNREIQANHLVEVKIIPFAKAQEEGVMALFGEKYGEKVRVLKIGDFSVELCGGTHVQRTGDIGLFKITSEGGVAAGIRRLEAVTGEYALSWIREQQQYLQALSQIVKAEPDQLLTKVNELLEKQRRLEKEIKQLKNELVSQTSSKLLTQVQEISGVNVLAAELPEMEVTGLRHSLDQIRQRIGDAVVVLATKQANKVYLVSSVSKKYTKVIQANQLVNHIAKYVGGKGGGRVDMAQAGGTQPEKLPQALKETYTWVAERLLHSRSSFE